MTAAVSPHTDRLLAEAFASQAMVTAREAARVLGLDLGTFGALVDAGAVRCVRIGRTGSTRRYTEADLRAFLTRETELPPCPSKPRPARVTHPKVVPFTQLRDDGRR